MKKTCAKLGYGLAMFKLNEQNLCQAKLGINNAESKWTKLLPS